MNFSINERNFYLNNKKVFLTSGEIHYFRVKRELWDIHLKAAVEAGLTTVSTYVPWAIHESVEGVFDFEGISKPEYDLKGWLECCKSYGLHCIVKPGPFILAEYRGAGLPEWFLQKYSDDIKMRNSKGEIVQSDGVSLFKSVYLEKVKTWYDHIMPFISQRQLSVGGPVVMVQICNEIGVFSWLAHQADYCPEVKEKFIAYLIKKFVHIQEINKLWGTNYSDFSSIELPPDGQSPYRSKYDRSRDYEWHCFWRTYYGEYLRMLASMARDRGITVPLYHNLPGWIYGNGYEFPVNITMYQDLFRDKSEIVFGVDHIPEFFSYRNMHDDRIINDITYAMQGNKPLFAAEFQSGSREYNVVPSQREMELFYKASVANGLTGWNYYMFSQGRNSPRTGHSGSTFYWYNPLTAEGERTSAFTLVQRINRMVKTFESLIVDANRKAEICVIFYPPYYASELERPIDSASELQFAATSIRRSAYFDGLLKALQVLNIDYDMADLTTISVVNLLKYKQVWAFCTDEMNESDQRQIVDYAKAGGNMVLFPYLPDREMSQLPCNIIREALQISPIGVETVDSPLIDIYHLKDIKCANPQSVFSEESLIGAEIIARTVRGTACGFVKKIGKGVVTHVGTYLGYDSEGQIPAYESILQSSCAKLRQASADNGNIAVRQRFTDNNSGTLFVANYYNDEHVSRITYTHPESGSDISMPYFKEAMLLPALYGILSPICFAIINNISILHTTSDILQIDNKSGNIQIILFGDRDLCGEIVFEGAGINQIANITIDGNPVEILRDTLRVGCVYAHSHKKEITLLMTFK